MSESFLNLSARDKADALRVAVSASGRPGSLLEKDIWVVWALSTLFESPLGSHLVFKGGTALSKAYRAGNQVLLKGRFWHQNGRSVRLLL
jgi:predicted nucleotidyltransferase component of viral defense system